MRRHSLILDALEIDFLFLICTSVASNIDQYEIAFGWYTRWASIAKILLRKVPKDGCGVTCIANLRFATNAAVGKLTLVPFWTLRARN